MTRPGDIRLIATDLDGTLVHSDGSVSERTRSVLRRARQAGLTVVVVTGRPPRGVRSLELGDAVDESLCANGALVYDEASGRLTVERALPEPVALRLVTDLRQAAPGVAFAGEAGLQYCREPGYETFHPLDGADAIVEPAERFALRGLAKLLVRHMEIPQKALLPLAEAVAGDEAVITRSGTVILEIGPAGVTKATALAALCGELGLEPRHVVAFGDMVNDIPMLRWAGRSVAVANAHMDVLAVARETTAAADDDGVAAYLERLLEA
jgi:Cof subfamily protein (haloacid dehalogenase superfamily)